MKANILIMFILLMAVFPDALKAEIAEPIAIPTFISYVEPIEKGVKIDEKKGITDWTSDQIEIQCYFHLSGTGKLNLALLANSANDANILKVSLNGNFYLFNGGFVPGTAKYGDHFTRPFSPSKPDHIHLLTGMRHNQSLSDLMQDVKGD